MAFFDGFSTKRHFSIYFFYVFILFSELSEQQEQKLGPWVFKGDVMTDPSYRIEHTFYSDCVWRRWDCAALVHEALLWRLEQRRVRFRPGVRRFSLDFPLFFLQRTLRNGASSRNSSCLFDFGIFDFHAHGYETMSDGLGRSIDWNDNFFAFQHEDFDDIDWAAGLLCGRFSASRSC